MPRPVHLPEAPGAPALRLRRRRRRHKNITARRQLPESGCAHKFLPGGVGFVARALGQVVADV
jgi:hypothetical protein